MLEIFLLFSGSSSLFQNSLFEHGAGGSLGAIFYSGMPFAESVSDEFSLPGIMRFGWEMSGLLFYH